uniref:Uncharacterized protein n=1 Tax=Sus scrofa TaxID=9823 RepID=A0A8D1FV37_PIG
MIRLVVIFLPLMISVEVDTDLKVPLPPPPPPQDMEKEERPPFPKEAKEVNPVSKEETPPLNAGNSLKVEKRGADPLFLLTRELLRPPIMFSRGSGKKSKENGSQPPKNSLKTSAGSRKLKTPSEGRSKGLPPPRPSTPAAPQRS